MSFPVIPFHVIMTLSYETTEAKWAGTANAVVPKHVGENDFSLFQRALDICDKSIREKMPAIPEGLVPVVLFYRAVDNRPMQ